MAGKKRTVKSPPVPVLAKGKTKKRRPLKKAKPGLGPSPLHGQH
jgi:hypothetical protein